MRFPAPRLLPVAALAAAFLLTGCGEQQTTESGEKIKRLTFVTMQLSPTFDDYVNGMIDEFEAEHPAVRIEWLDFPYQNYATKILTSFMGNEPPDVINLPSDSIKNYVDPGYLLPLDEYVSEETKDSYVAELLDGCKVDDTLYGLPWYAASGVTFVNTAILEEAGLPPEPPEFYDNMEEIARTVKEETGKFAIFPMYTEAGTFRQFLVEAGLPLLNESETKAAFNTEETVEMLKFWTDLYRNDLVPSEALTATHLRPIELFKTGDLAILVTGPQFIRKIESDAPNIYEQTEVGPLMRWKGQYNYIVELHAMSVGHATEHPELAAEFAAFVTNAENQLELTKLTTILPSQVESLKDPYFTDPEDTLIGRARRYSASQGIQGKVYESFPANRKILKVFDEMVEDVALGKMSAEEGVTWAEERVNEILAESK